MFRESVLLALSVIPFVNFASSPEATLKRSDRFTFQRFDNQVGQAGLAIQRTIDEQEFLSPSL